LSARSSPEILKSPLYSELTFSGVSQLTYSGVT
jgi:hypothetical protein